MELKENKCDRCRWRWEMNKEHCGKCKYYPENKSVSSDEPDNFETKE